MPAKLYHALDDEDDRNHLHNVIPKLHQLLTRDSDIDIAYLCRPSAMQVFKTSDEGAHFCGYRNMQMLCLACDLPVASDPQRKLTVSRLQELIEHAWDLGINAHAREQTGGILGSRKHVGTSEVCFHLTTPVLITFSSPQQCM